MNTALIAAALLAATGPAPAAPDQTAPEPPDGGMVLVNARGRLAVVDAGSADGEALASAARKIGNFFMIATETQPGDWSLEKADRSLAATGANAAVFVVRNAALPISLIAMEARWGVVNADGLSREALEKEILRVAIVLLGGASSKYEASTMRPAFSAEDLEKVGNLVTIDSLMAIFPNLERYGFKQYVMMSYRDACEEGVAPEPVNDVQRRIAAEFKSPQK